VLDAERAPLDAERAPLARRSLSRAGDYERGVDLEATGRGLLVAGVASAIGGIVLIVSGVLLQRADADRDVDDATSDGVFESEPDVSSGPRNRGTVMMWFGVAALGPLAHGLTIPGAFMLVRGRNLQRRAEFGALSMRLRF
jgi:hypothetical protein